MFRSFLLVLGVAVAMIGCELVPETAYVPEDAAEATNNWLADFTHTNPEYVDQAKSAFAFAADGELCQAARRFEDLVEDARAHDGSRMPVAAYNAGVLFIRQVGNGTHCGPSHPDDQNPVLLLEYALKHMPDREMDAEIHMQLGWAYVLQLEAPTRTYWNQGPPADLKAMSIEHYCSASNLKPPYREQVNELFDELEWSQCES